MRKELILNLHFRTPAENVPYILLTYRALVGFISSEYNANNISANWKNSDNVEFTKQIFSELDQSTTKILRIKYVFDFITEPNHRVAISFVEHTIEHELGHMISALLECETECNYTITCTESGTDS